MNGKKIKKVICKLCDGLKLAYGGRNIELDEPFGNKASS